MSRGSSGLDDLDHPCPLFPFAVQLDLERHDLVEPGLTHARRERFDVDEYLLATLRGLDEPEATFGTP